MFYISGMAKQTRDCSILIRMTKAEREAIRKAAKSHPGAQRSGPPSKVGDWCRDTLLGAAKAKANETKQEAK